MVETKKRVKPRFCTGTELQAICNHGRLGWPPLQIHNFPFWKFMYVPLPRLHLEAHLSYGNSKATSFHGYRFR